MGIVLVLFACSVACDAGRASKEPVAPPPARRADAAAVAALAYGSADDVADILRANGVVPPPLHCTNVSYASDPTHAPIRTVACRLELTDGDVTRLAREVPLAPGPPFHPPPDYAGSCDTEGVRVLRGTNTKVANGAGDIELHVARGRTCIEITYPWSE